MNKYMILFFVTLSVLVSGCKAPSYTENYQAATVRTASDIAMTVTAERTGMTSVDMLKVIRIATEIDIFLNTGDMSTVTNRELMDVLILKIPIYYRPHFAAVLASISVPRINIQDKVSPKILRLLKNSIYGVISAAENWCDVPDSK